MITTLENHIRHYFEKAEILPRARLIAAIQGDFPQWSTATINVYLSKLKKAGLLKSPARGYYAISNKEDFKHQVEAEMKKLANKIRRELPYVTLCVWNTKWLNTFMRHQPFKHFTVVEVERDAMEQVFRIINEMSDEGYMDPNTLVFDLYVSDAEKPIIIRPLVSEAPMEPKGKYAVPMLEKLLVDMLADPVLFAAQQGELRDIFANALSRYNVNYLKMKRYAVRRNRERELQEIMSITSAENPISAKM